jgi:FkbM family methyltransferase
MTHPRQLVEVEATFGRMFAFEDDLATSQIREFGNHTRPEIAFLLSVVQPGDSVFDIGAHIGTFTIPLANRVGAGGRVLAVEGAAANFEVLRANLDRLRPPAEVTALNAVVAAADAQPLAIRHQPGNTGASFFVPGDSGGAETPLVSLDELARRYFAPRVLKIDIEGMEHAALHGSALLRQARPIIYAEVSEQQLARASASLTQLNQLLTSHGYRLFRNTGDRNAAHDNFFVAELMSLADGGDFFDVLAVHQGDTRLSEVSGNAIAGARAPG